MVRGEPMKGDDLGSFLNCVKRGTSRGSLEGIIKRGEGGVGGGSGGYKGVSGSRPGTFGRAEPTNGSYDEMIPRLRKLKSPPS